MQHNLTHNRQEKQTQTKTETETKEKGFSFSNGGQGRKVMCTIQSCHQKYEVITTS